jgi:CHAD domain-containing protein
VLDAVAWTETGSWLKEDQAAVGQLPIADFAAKELARRAKKVRRRGAGLETLDPEARHRVRIEIKKLRYAAESFPLCFPENGAPSS